MSLPTPFFSRCHLHLSPRVRRMSNKTSCPTVDKFVNNVMMHCLLQPGYIHNTYTVALIHLRMTTAQASKKLTVNVVLLLGGGGALQLSGWLMALGKVALHASGRMVKNKRKQLDQGTVCQDTSPARGHRTKQGASPVGHCCKGRCRASYIPVNLLLLSLLLQVGLQPAR
jgi:hypothetical protein